MQPGDVYVADGFGKIIEGTLIGSNLGSGIAAHSRTGFVFDSGCRLSKYLAHIYSDYVAH
jgi:hypothetical protein